MEEKNLCYYEDLAPDVFVTIDRCLGEGLEGYYEMNKLLHIRNKTTGEIYTKYKNINADGYPIKNFYRKDETTGIVYTKKVPIHILAAKMFKPNLENKPCVDHIDRDKSNYSLSNLRWSTYSENNKNRNPSLKNDLYIKLDNFGNEIKIFTKDDLSNSQRHSIYKSIKNNKKYLGYFWKVINKEVYDFISKNGEPAPNLWFTSLEEPETLLCHSSGLLKNYNFGTKRWELTLGSKSGKYFKIKLKTKKVISVHRLIYEAISGELLPEDIQIDHINGNGFDNRFENLRPTTRKENMNNPVTLERMSKKVLAYYPNGEFFRKFNSGQEFVKFLGWENSCGLNKNNTITGGYIWCYEGEEDVVIPQKLKKIVFKYDKDFLRVDCFRYISQVAKKLKCDPKTLKKYIQSGELAPDGYYYSYGPREFKTEES